MDEDSGSGTINISPMKRNPHGTAVCSDQLPHGGDFWPRDSGAQSFVCACRMHSLVARSIVYDMNHEEHTNNNITQSNLIIVHSEY
ncbi:unnamed protein product [Macrosiphum euphorbiae]|uniref:Uncharacterized protein n=1 Tax=Macrosiphum euphorbiae TaxID=13131 RepID=A0AAV0X790_9HEMI|nr:unnamed protein product [Macrosiphum euphorbiae]